MRAYILCCMRVSVSLCVGTLSDSDSYYTCSILLVHSFLVFLFFVPIIIYAVLCMCPHAHRCLPAFISLHLSPSPYFFATQRRFTKNGAYERKGKLRVEKENFNEMKWNEQKKLKKQQQQHVRCAFAVIEHSFETFRCAPSYVCFAVAGSSSWLWKNYACFHEFQRLKRTANYGSQSDSSNEGKREHIGSNWSVLTVSIYRSASTASEIP